MQDHRRNSLSTSGGSSYLSSAPVGSSGAGERQKARRVSIKRAQWRNGSRPVPPPPDLPVRLMQPGEGWCFWRDKCPHPTQAPGPAEPVRHLFSNCTEDILQSCVSWHLARSSVWESPQHPQRPEAARGLRLRPQPGRSRQASLAVGRSPGDPAGVGVHSLGLGLGQSQLWHQDGQGGSTHLAGPWIWCERASPRSLSSSASRSSCHVQGRQGCQTCLRAFQPSFAGEGGRATRIQGMAPRQEALGLEQQAPHPRVLPSPAPVPSRPRRVGPLPPHRHRGSGTSADPPHWAPVPSFLLELT